MQKPETEGEHQVPAEVWKAPHFQSWLQAQKGAGNRLDGYKSVFRFPEGGRPFFWAGHVNVYVASEDRNKVNEVVISRPDIMHIVLLYKHPGADDKVQAIMVREFRSPAATANGFILETPGGSSLKGEDPLAIASEELVEETGVRISPDRLVPIGTRQLMGTMSTHKAHVYAAQLNEDDMALVTEQLGKVHGNEGDSERTFVEIHDVAGLLSEEATDWSTLGMIYAAREALHI